jgi:glycosyltransferase involved in cell wall biosynthesis
VHCGDTGGEAHHVIMLAKTINRELFSMDIACPQNSLFNYFSNYDLTSYGSQVYPIKLHSYFLSRIDLQGIWQIYKLILRNKYELVHVHQVSSGVIGRVAARLAGCKIVVTESGITSEHYWIKGRIKKFIHTSIIHPLWNTFFVDAMIAISHVVRKSVIQREHISPKKAFYIPYGTDDFPLLSAERKTAARQRLSLPQDSVIIGSVGRFTEQKGYEYLLRALERLVGQYPDLLVVLAGDGDLLHSLKELSNNLSIADHVRFLGWQKDTSTIYDALDVFVLPSLWETFGLVLVEAMAHGKPVVSTSVDAIPEIVENGQTGILVRPKNIDELYGAILNLMNDPDLAAEMGRKGRLRAETYFSRESTTGRIEALYRQLLQ